ncbi:hypothetical protein [Pseudescherichia sp.]|uniref:hypothetical protein n=1 Tax=Pseudescherichia sp. TaxID=2055881 RepID=UPI002896F414|nr:hypothetical protein [Pseudescherichia sp.]
MLKKTLAVVVFGVVFSGSAFANESFGIMNDRLSSAMRENANNNNVGTQTHVLDAYNAAKGAIGGSMDNSKTLSSTPDASSSITDPRTSLSTPNQTQLKPIKLIMLSVSRILMPKTKHLSHRST